MLKQTNSNEYRSRYAKVIEHNLYINFIFLLSISYFLLFGIQLNFETPPLFNAVLEVLDIIMIAYVSIDFASRLYFSLLDRDYRSIVSIWNIIDIALIVVTLGAFANLAWIRIFRVLFLLHFIQKVNLKILHFRESALFNRLNIVVLLLFVVLLGVKNSIGITEDLEIVFKILDFIILVYFTFEIAVKMLSREKISTFFYANNTFNLWNIFDFVIVGLSLLPLDSMSGLAIARVIRVLRVLRLISSLPELKKIMKALSFSMTSIFYVLFLLFIIFFVYANIGIQFFGHFSYEQGAPNLWKDLPSALLTLYRVLTFEDWTDVMYQSMQEYPTFGWIFFVSFTVITAFIFLNLFTGIIMEQIQKANSHVLKFKLKDEKDDINDGIKLYSMENPIFIINISSKISYLLSELNHKAIIDKTVQNIVIVLNDYDKTLDYIEGNLFLGFYAKLNIKFVYADVNYPETHHRFNFETAQSIIILSDDETAKQGSITADNLNIKLFTYIMNNKRFMVHLLHRFLRYDRINCLIEVNSETSANMVAILMEKSITHMVELMHTQTCHQINNDVLLKDKFLNVKKLLFARAKRSNSYLDTFPKRDFFAIVNQSYFGDSVLTQSIEYFLIYKTMLDMFDFQGYHVNYIPNPIASSKRHKEKTLRFHDVVASYHEGILIGVSKKDASGYIKQIIAPSQNIIIEEKDFLIVLSHENTMHIPVDTTSSTKLAPLHYTHIDRNKRMLLIEDNARELSLKQTENTSVIKGGSISQYLRNPQRILEDLHKHDIQTIVINIDDNSANYFIFQLKELLSEEDMAKVVLVLDHQISAKLLKDSYLKFDHTVLPDQFSSLLISSIAYNSHSQDLIKELGVIGENRRLSRIKIPNHGVKSFEEFKQRLLQTGYIYIASVRNNEEVIINDTDIKTIAEVIVLQLQEV